MGILCLVPLSASAQWYLFPDKKKGRKVEEIIEENVGHQKVGRRDSLKVSVTLMLPLKASSDNANENFIEMYCGSLLALRDLGEEGLAADLRVIDTAAPGFTFNDDIVNGSDVTIGPVSYSDIQKALVLCDSSRVLISPLEPKAAQLIRTGELVQSPAPWSAQIDEMVDWLTEETLMGDEILVLRDTSAAGFGEQSAYLLDQLKDSGLRYRVIFSTSQASFSKYGRYRLLIASDSDGYTAGAVRHLWISAAQGNEITLYCTSKVRNSLGSNTKELHATDTRLAASYFIDYNSRKVKDFIIKYRSFFRTEPGSFAFQGYDTMYYFLKMYAQYGEGWDDALPESPAKGLQSDFLFDEGVEEGRLNMAVRRVVYGKDLSMSLQ